MLPRPGPGVTPRPGAGPRSWPGPWAAPGPGGRSCGPGHHCSQSTSNWQRQKKKEKIAYCCYQVSPGEQNQAVKQSGANSQQWGAFKGHRFFLDTVHLHNEQSCNCHLTNHPQGTRAQLYIYLKYVIKKKQISVRHLNFPPHHWLHKRCIFWQYQYLSVYSVSVRSKICSVTSTLTVLNPTIFRCFDEDQWFWVK